MRVILADLRGVDGFVSKDTVAAGYGSRLKPFSKGTRGIYNLKKRLHDPPSIQMAYLAAIAAEGGHEVVFTTGDEPIESLRGALSAMLDARS